MNKKTIALLVAFVLCAAAIAFFGVRFSQESAAHQEAAARLEEAKAVNTRLEEEKTALSSDLAAETEAKTGVEMEALTGVTVALLTLYDMCKAIDKSMIISDVRLISKTGGKSGDYKIEG